MRAKNTYFNAKRNIINRIWYGMDKTPILLKSSFQIQICICAHIVKQYTL